ncbi:MAG: hypothetical protein R3C14_00855 [Caldilineaceae bacterium]
MLRNQTNLQSLPQLIATLRDHPLVVGLVEYGANSSTTSFTAGDYDLFVITAGATAAVESLHFYINQIPVDLNLRELTALRQATRLTGFEQALLTGRLIYDRDGAVAAELARLRHAEQDHTRTPLSPHDRALIRHGHQHVLDKVRGRLETMPLLCHLLLHTNIYWLIQTYHHIHGLVYRGEKAALAHLAQHEPTIYSKIEQFYTAPTLPTQVALAQELSELVLQPIGGLWQQDEILVFGAADNETLPQAGAALAQQLFG